MRSIPRPADGIKFTCLQMGDGLVRHPVVAKLRRQVFSIVSDELAGAHVLGLYIENGDIGFRQFDLQENAIQTDKTTKFRLQTSYIKIDSALK